MTQRFQTLSLVTCANEQASSPASVTMIDNVISVLLDGQTRAWAALKPQADARQAWRMTVVDVHLPTPTRRPFLVQIRAAMNAMRGHALVRISTEGRTTSRQLSAGLEPKAAELNISLHIRRSPQPRDRLRLHVWTEANVQADGGEAEAAVEAIDVLAR